MGILACIGVITPFPFYYYLWNNPQTWVNLCRKYQDPSKIMAIVSHFFKFIQFLSLFSVSTLSWPPPFYFWPLFLFVSGSLRCVFPILRVKILKTTSSECLFKGGSRVYQLLGESGTYYGVRFGKNIPWVTKFPFGTIKDPQYVGSIMSLLACVMWVPFLYIFIWVLGYLFMIHIESKEDPSFRAKPLS